MTLRRSRIATGGVLATSLILGLSACGGDDGDGDASGETGDDCAQDEVTIAYQPGLGYAPLLVAKQQETLEDANPDVTITWQELNSGSTIRDGILSGDIDVGSGGIGPFVVGYAGGVDWKVVTGLNKMSLYLMAADPAVESLEDLQGAGGIAMPAPDSIQSVVLRKGAEEELGDATALDSQIVSMGHPDGVQALIAGQIAAHLTAPPFQGQEEESGAHKLLDSYELFGEHTFNSVFTTTEFEGCNPEFVDSLITAVADADTMLTDEPEEAAEILATETGGEADVLLEQITADDVEFSTTPTGFGAFAEFMQSIDMIKEVPDTADLFFENEATADAT